MSDNGDTVGTASHFVENNLSIKTLLCLTTTDDAEGRPVSKTESLRRHLPIRLFARIAYIDNDQTKFSINLVNDPRDFVEFRFKLNQYYSDTMMRAEVEKESREVGGLYVCRIGNEYHRCRLTRLDKDYCDVYLLDLGTHTNVRFSDLYAMAYQFYGMEDLSYAFALQCCVPDPETSQDMGLPILSEFVVGEVVDVVICSLHEPCLAIVGSTRKYYSRIFPESLVDGLDEVASAIWQSNFTNPLPSFNGITTGQYPPAQPTTTTDSWVLATVAAVNSLTAVHIRDIRCSIRLSVIQEIINDFYLDEKCRAQMFFADVTPLTRDLPCVVFDQLSMQYFRGKIVSLSGDRSLADVVCVDYPSISFKSVERKDIFMLSEKFFIPPQCFAVPLVDDDVTRNMHDFTVSARHFVEVGSVVSVYQSPKSTVVVMKTTAGDILERIGLRKNEEPQAEAKPASLPKYRTSPICCFNASAASTIRSVITAKPKYPVGAVTAFIATVRNANQLYYRKSNEAAEYDKIQSLLNALNKSLLVAFSEENVRRVIVGRMYMLAAAPDFELYRIRILKNGDDIHYVRLDDGEQGIFFTGVDRLYDIPFELERFPPAVIGPCRLARPEDVLLPPDIDNYLKDMRLVSKLRLLIPENRSCMVQERRQPSTPKTGGSPLTNMRPAAEVMLFKPDGSNINKTYFTMVADFIRNDKSDKNWQQK